MGTTAKTAAAMKSASTSGVRHGASQKHTNATSKPKGVMGSGMSKSTVAPIKGQNKGGLC